jgi:hypothetical protein
MARQWMLNVKTWNFDTMTMAKKSALFLLAITVFWTTMPSSACLLTMHTTERHSCCGIMNMTLACVPAGTTTNRSCCQIGHEELALSQVSQSSSEHSQRLAFVPIRASLQAPTSHGAMCRNVQEAPPPKSSPGGISVLRI